MPSCSLCAAPLDASAASCPRCGIAARPAAVRRRGPVRRALAAIALVALVGGAVATAAPAVSAWRAAARCEPQSWADWHLALKRECVTPAYVCSHMTTAKLFSDPQVGDAYRGAVESGDSATAANLEALVDHLRSAYGCDGPAEVHGRASPRTPRTPRLPPGHPPIGPGHPGVDGAPSAPANGLLFEAPSVTEI